MTVSIWRDGQIIDVPDDSVFTGNVAEFAHPKPPVLYAACQLSISGTDISGIGVNSRFGGAFWGDVGKYYVFFAETQPDANYIVMSSSPAVSAYVLEEDKTEDMFVITVTDGTGQLVDTQTVNIQILRAS